MDETSAESGTGVPISLEINANHRYRAGQMGVLEFRVRNQSAAMIQTLSLLIDCPCEISRKKSSVLKTLAPASEKKSSFQFEPARGGEALLGIELCLEDAGKVPTVYSGHASVDIAAIDEVSKPSTSFNLDIHDIGKFMGNDLSGMLSLAGKELNEDRLRERMERKEPFWMRVDLDLDEQETMNRRDAAQKILCIPGGVPPETRRAVLESLESSFPLRAFLFSSPEVRFGRHAQKNDAVLRFLPDFQNDDRSKTISGEQFVARYSSGQCLMALAQSGRAATLINGRTLIQGEQVPILNGAEIKIGSHEFRLQVYASPRGDDPQWKRTFEKILSFAPGEDVFRASRWDYISFSRPANGQEEQYLWLLRKIDLGWSAERTLEFSLGQAALPRARLSYCIGRYFLETLDSGSEIRVGDRMLQTGEIVCLGSQTEILFGRQFRFRWSLL